MKNEEEKEYRKKLFFQTSYEKDRYYKAICFFKNTHNSVFQHPKSLATICFNIKSTIRA